MKNREIDTIIAEKVFNWELMKDTSMVERGFLTYRKMRNDWDWQETLVPEFSKDILAAWGVAEKLEELFECVISIQIYPKRGGLDKFWTGERWERRRYSVTVSGGDLEYDSPSCSFAIYDNLLCEAICLAALKAVGVE